MRNMSICLVFVLFFVDMSTIFLVFVLFFVDMSTILLAREQGRARRVGDFCLRRPSGQPPPPLFWRLSNCVRNLFAGELDTHGCMLWVP